MFPLESITLWKEIMNKTNYNFKKDHCEAIKKRTLDHKLLRSFPQGQHIFHKFGSCKLSSNYFLTGDHMKSTLA